MLCRVGLRRFTGCTIYLRQSTACRPSLAGLAGLAATTTRGTYHHQRLYSSTAAFRDLENWCAPATHRSVSDTIYALSTAPGRAAIALIRVSGPACLDIYRLLCPSRPLPAPRTATLRKLFDPTDVKCTERRVLDPGALLLYFPAPKTVTGEDVLELHVHGGTAITRSVLEALANCGKLLFKKGVIRHAESGEFTKRAFYNGRMDLTEAEALGETLAAETEQQRRLAVNGSDGGLAKRYEEWRTMLLYARGELEALIDFSEDQHFDESPAQFVASIFQQVVTLRRQIGLHIQNASKGELLRHGISIALLGAPNAGKSSLLNRIVGREAAIVSAEEGTTRDIVDVSIDLNGWLCRLGDMAGLRTKHHNNVGSVEREGIRRARERALQSDVVVVLLAVEVNNHGALQIPVNDEVLEAVQECHVAGKTILVVLNKIDLVAEQMGRKDEAVRHLHARVCQMFPMVPDRRVCTISCREATNIDAGSNRDPGDLKAFLAELTTAFQHLTTAFFGEAQDMSMTASEAQAYWTASLSVTHRQSTYLAECLHHLEDFLLVAQSPPHAQSHARSGADEGSEFSDPSPQSDYCVDRRDDLVGPNIAPDVDGEGAFDIVTAAEHLRFAAHSLAKITGKGTSGEVEDILGVVFEK